MKYSLPKGGFIFFSVLLYITNISAHHVLGRPAYSLNEDSNTPPSMQIEVQIGDYLITMMAFPAFPKPNQAGRLNLYASRLDNGKPYTGQVTFYVLDNHWFSDQKETLGTQIVDDFVFRQGFLFKNEGKYIIRAMFEADNQPYTVDFPLQVGQPSPLGLIGSIVIFFILLLGTVRWLQHKRLQALTKKINSPET